MGCLMITFFLLDHLVGKYNKILNNAQYRSAQTYIFFLVALHGIQLGIVYFMP
jgi:hypothetical protein